MKDKDLWEKYTANIKPLSKDKKEVPPHEESPQPRPKVKDSPPYSSSQDQNSTPFNPHRPADIDKNSFARLKKGKMPIEGRLDLHGYTHKQAFELLHKKLRIWQASGKRCVLVITGKGLRSENPRDTLKHRVPEWLNQGELRSLMVAYTAAQPKDGGSGALYVLLKSNRDKAL